jgi:hypothetical protein
MGSKVEQASKDETRIEFDILKADTTVGGTKVSLAVDNDPTSVAPGTHISVEAKGEKIGITVLEDGKKIGMNVRGKDGAKEYREFEGPKTEAIAEKLNATLAKVLDGGTLTPEHAADLAKNAKAFATGAQQMLALEKAQEAANLVSKPKGVSFTPNGAAHAAQGAGQERSR